MRQPIPLREMLCSTARLIDSTRPAIVSAMALRMAGPSTGEIAVAIARGLRRTDSLMAISTVVASARASCRSRPARRAIASGSISASSSGVMPSASSRRRSSSSWRCSPPSRSSRSSANSADAGSYSPVPASRPGGAKSSATSASRRALPCPPVVAAQPGCHVRKEPGDGRGIGLLGPQLLHRTGELRGELQQAFAKLGVRHPGRFLELGMPLLQGAERLLEGSLQSLEVLGAPGPLRGEPFAQRLDFLLKGGLELGDLLGEIGADGFLALQQPGLGGIEAGLDGAHLAAEEDVANLVETFRRRLCGGRAIAGRFVPLPGGLGHDKPFPELILQFYRSPESSAISGIQTRAGRDIMRQNRDVTRGSDGRLGGGAS